MRARVVRGQGDDSELVDRDGWRGATGRLGARERGGASSPASNTDPRHRLPTSRARGWMPLWRQSGPRHPAKAARRVRGPSFPRVLGSGGRMGVCRGRPPPWSRPSWMVVRVLVRSPSRGRYCEERGARDGGDSGSLRDASECPPSGKSGDGARARGARSRLWRRRRHRRSLSLQELPAHTHSDQPAICRRRLSLWRRTCARACERERALKRTHTHLSPKRTTKRAK
jgi:hypothetical protein